MTCTIKRCKQRLIFTSLRVEHVNLWQNRPYISVKTVAHHFFNSDVLLPLKEEPGMPFSVS